MRRERSVAGCQRSGGANFRPEFIAGHQKITDAYLLAIAVRHGGKLATFDRSIPIKAVKGASSEQVELLGSE